MFISKQNTSFDPNYLYDDCYIDLLPLIFKATECTISSLLILEPFQPGLPPHSLLHWTQFLLKYLKKHFVAKSQSLLFYLHSPGPLCCFCHCSILCLNILSFHSFCNSVFFWFLVISSVFLFDSSSSTPLSKDPNRIPSLPPLLTLLPLGDPSMICSHGISYNI